ncbi:MAG: hypothetical protein ACK56I_01930, partial [bacterium]
STMSCSAVAEEEQAAHFAVQPFIDAGTPGLLFYIEVQRTHRRFLYNTGAACFTLCLHDPAGQLIHTRTMAVITANGECSSARLALHSSPERPALHTSPEQLALHSSP